MKIFKIILLVILLLQVAACEDPIDKSLSPLETGLIVVEGILTSENTNHLVKISLPYKTQNATPAPASGAIVTITDGSTVYNLTESPIGSGQYYTPIMRAVTGKTYALLIQFQGKEYTAQDRPVPVEALPSIQYYKTGDAYTLDFKESGNEPNYINHAISWSTTPTCTAPGGCTQKVVFYDLKTIDIHEVYKPKKEAFYFPLDTKIVRVKYSVSEAYKIFLRSMLSETEWRGGVFDVQRENVSTNLSEGAVGFFATSTIVSDTTIVK